MDTNRLSKAAALIGEPSRAAMLWSLLGGESRPASELAMLANVSPQTTSNHLRLLLDAGLVTSTSVGRNKFYKLAGPAIATALESLAGAIYTKPGDGTALRTAPELVFARTCYDHLAGELGVALLSYMRKMGYLRERTRNYQLSASGERFLANLGVDLSTARVARRRFAYPCLDWSHRLPHLGGALGAAMLDWLFQSKILVARKASRAVRITESGEKRLTKFGIHLARKGGIARAA